MTREEEDALLEEVTHAEFAPTTSARRPASHPQPAFPSQPRATFGSEAWRVAIDTLEDFGEKMQSQLAQ